METITHNHDRSRFEARREGEVVGFTKYRLKNGVATFDHTEVKPEFRGHGIGARLVTAAMAEVRTTGWKVRPDCWFVAEWFEQHPDQTDLLAK